MHGDPPNVAKIFMNTRQIIYNKAMEWVGEGGIGGGLEGGIMKTLL